MTLKAIMLFYYFDIRLDHLKASDMLEQSQVSNFIYCSTVTSLYIHTFISSQGEENIGTPWIDAVFIQDAYLYIDFTPRIESEKLGSVLFADHN
jgi:hypothetical protein